MALAPSAFLLPLGDTNPQHFPLTAKERDGGQYADEEAKATALVSAWIEQAEAAHPADEAVQALYVDARAKASAYRTVLANPATESADGEGSFAYAAAQIQGLQADYLAAQAAYRAASEAAPVVAPLRSVDVTNEVAW